MLQLSKSLCIALPILVVMCSLSVICAPVKPNLQRVVYKIVSENSGQYITVTRGGRVNAHATNPTRRTQFYPSFNETDGTMKFESKKFNGRFLTLDERKGKIKLGEPQNGNEKFISERLTPAYFALRSANNNSCFIAFDEEGELVDPCGFSLSDLEVRLFFVIDD